MFKKDTGIKINLYELDSSEVLMDTSNDLYNLSLVSALIADDG